MRARNISWQNPRLTHHSVTRLPGTLTNPRIFFVCCGNQEPVTDQRNKFGFVGYGFVSYGGYCSFSTHAFLYIVSRYSLIVAELWLITQPDQKKSKLKDLGESEKLNWNWKCFNNYLTVVPNSSGKQRDALSRLLSKYKFRYHRSTTVNNKESYFYYKANSMWETSSVSHVCLKNGFVPRAYLKHSTFCDSWSNKI